MTHLIYIYLIINSFIVGYCFEDNIRFNGKLQTFLFSTVLLFFGAILMPLYYILPVFAIGIGYIVNEIKFQYRMVFTDYFDNIFLDDDYTDDYDSREKKLKRTEELAQNSSKQIQRHNKQIQKKYGRENI
jgi:hypothetical protein